VNIGLILYVRADEEDELLYGDSDSNVLLSQMQPTKPPSPPKIQQSTPEEVTAPKTKNDSGETYWLALVRESGSLEVRYFSVIILLAWLF